MLDDSEQTTQAGSFEAFYHREFVAIALVAGTTAGDRVRGEDIAQEAMARASDRWPQLLEFDKPGAWVRRVALNLALDDRRKLRNRSRALQRLANQRPATQTANKAPAEPRDGEPAIWAAIDALPARQRAVVVMFYFDDRTVAEIADLLDIAVSTTTTHLHRARGALAKALKVNSSTPDTKGQDR